jgi:predicted transcriptional regulator
MNPKLRSAQRVRVLKALVEFGVDGATDYELGNRLNILRTSAGKRRKELLEIGLVARTGKTRPTDTGSSGIVWRVTDQGTEIARQLA